MNRNAAIPQKESQPAATPSATSFRRNNRSSSIGDGTLSSHQTKATINTTTTNAPPTTASDVHPSWCPLPTTSRNSKSIAPDRAAPTQSNPLLLSRSSSSGCRRSRMSSDAIMMMIPKGMLMKNTHRHPRALTSRPPNAGPAMAPLPTTLMLEPRALPRSRAGKEEMIIAIASPCIIAEPMPCRTRPKISMAMSVAMPDTADATR